MMDASYKGGNILIGVDSTMMELLGDDLFRKKVKDWQGELLVLEWFLMKIGIRKDVDDAFGVELDHPILSDVVTIQK